MQFETVRTAEQAIDRLEALHSQAVKAERHALEMFFTKGEEPSAEARSLFRYPELRVTYEPKGVLPSSRRAFAKFSHAGVYSTSVTHPGAFRTYLLEQLRPLIEEFGATLEVGISNTEIPYPYVFETGDELGGRGVSSAELARFFPMPLLSSVGDEIADGTWEQSISGERPLGLFDAPRMDYSLKRIVHYTGSHWRHCQPWIMLTNYHRYVDQFIQWGVAQIRSKSRFETVVLPGNAIITATMTDAEVDHIIQSNLWHKFQMPAYHVTTKDGQGVTLVNIGVGPSNAKNMTDHLAVLRPHCWLMVGHCGGLRQSQQIGDYVLAHGYLRQDRILDNLVPTDMPIPALAEVQVALQEAAAQVTGEKGEALKQRLRTGTVVTNDDRNWELRWTQERKRINLSRAIAVDMESGTIATQGFRLRVPYGTLLCVSDKPLHGEIKLPGAANAFYERSVAQHLEIGLAALELLRGRKDTLHSRKLRAFDEPPFR